MLGSRVKRGSAASFSSAVQIRSGGCGTRQRSRQRRTSGQWQFLSRVVSSRRCISQIPQHRSQLAPGSELCWGQTNRACQRALSSAQLAQRGGTESHRTARRAGARAWVVVDLLQHLRAADSQLGKSASKSRCLHHTNRSLAKIKKIVERAQVVQKNK